jgi:biopolymer transport protein ExbD
MVSKDGKLSAQGSDFDQGQLFEKLQEQLKSNPQLSLIIEADEELSHGIVVDMMDIAQEVGVASVQIGATQK